MGTLTILPPTDIFLLTPDTRSPDGSAQGWWNPTTLGSTDADIISGLTDGLIFICNDLPPVTEVIMLLKWDFDTPVFSLDGGPLLSFTDLPSGMILNGTITLAAEWNNGPSGPYLARFRTSEITQGIAVQFLFADLVTPGLPLVSSDPTVFISKSDFILDTFRLELAGPTSTPLGGLIVLGSGGLLPFVLTGLFETYSQQWEIFLPAGEPAHPGDQLHIIVPEPIDPGDHDLINVDQIKFTIPCTDDIIRTLYINKDGTFTIIQTDCSGNNEETILILPSSPFVITWTLTLIIIIIPWGFGDYEGDVDVAPHVNPPTPFPPTEFSGDVPLEPVEIEFADTTGIYRITPGKTNDTLYDPSRDGTTVDVAIPKPFAKTGFIGS